MDVILRMILALLFVKTMAHGSAITVKNISHGSQFEFDGSSSGYIITAGGYHPSTNSLANVYALDLNSGEWIALPPLPQLLRDFDLVLRNSSVYAVGGENGKSAVKSSLILSIEEKMWKTGSDLIYSNGLVLSASLNGFIYAVGGSSDGKALQAIGCSGAWRRLASSMYSHNHDRDAIAVLNGKIYVLGCDHQDEVYDPVTNTWTAIKMTTQDRCYAEIVALNGYIYVIGGANTKNERYDPATGELIYFEICLYNPIINFAAVTDGEMIYVFGGKIGGRGSGDISDKAQVYRPDLDLWQSMTPYPLAAGYMGAVYVKQLPTQ